MRQALITFLIASTILTMAGCVGGRGSSRQGFVVIAEFFDPSANIKELSKKNSNPPSSKEISEFIGLVLEKEGIDYLITGNGGVTQVNLWNSIDQEKATVILKRECKKKGYNLSFPKQ